MLLLSEFFWGSTTVSELNPYEKFLDGRPVDAILASTADAIAAHLQAVGPQKSATPPAPGKWSAAEIVCHLADCELVFGFRLRQTLAEDGPTIQPFDQEKWAAIYPGIPAADAQEAFATLRNWNLRMIRAALPAAANRPVTHPERGAMTFQTIVETMAGHDLNHLGQLRRIAGQPV
jgi:DinB superfamily